MKQLTPQKRQIEYDLMRILAMFSVIVTHVCGIIVHDLPVNSTEFIITNTIRAAITWEVPLFVMISGRFFLDPNKNISIKSIYTKYIKHIVIAFCIWSAIYTVYYMWCGWSMGGDVISGWKQYIFQFLTGPYHLWYVFMIAGLYVATPILRKITQDKKLMQYFIILFLISQFLYQYAVSIPGIGGTTNEILNKTYFYIALGYSGYYVLGYYLYKYGIPKKLEIPLYILSVLLIVLSCVGTTLESMYDGILNEFMSTYQTPNIIIESCGVYLFFINRVSKLKVSKKLETVIVNLGKWGFGIYLSHAIVIEFLDLAGMSPMFAFPLGILIMSVCTFIISALLTFVISKIPVLNKYLM